LRRIKYLMADEFTTTKGLGWIDAGRMQKDYQLVQTYLARLIRQRAPERLASMV
jgi:hypothetical protein